MGKAHAFFIGHTRYNTREDVLLEEQVIKMNYWIRDNLMWMIQQQYLTNAESAFLFELALHLTPNNRLFISSPQELVQKLRRSERSITAHLKALAEKGVICKDSDSGEWVVHPEIVIGCDPEQVPLHVAECAVRFRTEWEARAQVLPLALLPGKRYGVWREKASSC